MSRPNNEDISDHDFLEKIGRMPRKASCAVIRNAVTLYVLLRESDAPAWAKVSIVAALAYFISPIDAIPDFLPGGYIDDLAAMALLLGQLDVFMDAETLALVEQRLPSFCRRKDIESSI